MGEDFDASWARIGPRIAALVTAAQVGAARDGIAYVGDALAEQDIDVRPDFDSDPRSFAGSAYSIDGLVAGQLEPVLYGAVVNARTADAGSLAQRLDAGLTFLSMVVPSQVADASRAASGTQIFARPEIGYIRMVNPPCCKRCAVLAGAYFKHNAGFQRHPQCDCRHVPTYEADAEDVGYMIGPEDVKDLNATQRQAIADGADMNQVINARRVYTTREGVARPSYSADGLWTSEGTTRRGYASYVKRAIAKQRGELAKETATNVGRRGYVKNYVVRRTKRPTPEAIYKYAESREEAIKLLAANGYIVGDIRKVAASAL
jgi:hypothetical protein